MARGADQDPPPAACPFHEKATHVKGDLASVLRIPAPFAVLPCALLWVRLVGTRCKLGSDAPRCCHLANGVPQGGPRDRAQSPGRGVATLAAP